MTTAAEWVAGARPRTLALAVPPVLVGTAAASLGGPVSWGRAAAALTVALALQVGVNYANDYSDGVRGTDRDRRGPVRLTATGLASPRAVRDAAAASFAVAAVVGLALAVAVDLRLLLLGAAALLAAVTYTGGKRPYGYRGGGEVAVLAFFGFAATAGSAYVQHRDVPAAAWWGAVAVGLPACAVLLANNLRDLDTDRAAGKLTLAVRLGARRARALFTLLLAGAFAAVVVIGASDPWALLALGAAPLALAPVRLVRSDAAGRALVGALGGTVRCALVLGVLLAVGLALS